eukprot:6484834-Amphidinium_carterae.3
MPGLNWPCTARLCMSAIAVALLSTSRASNPGLGSGTIARPSCKGRLEKCCDGHLPMAQVGNEAHGEQACRALWLKGVWHACIRQRAAHVASSSRPSKWIVQTTPQKGKQLVEIPTAIHHLWPRLWHEMQ